ncbi:MAG: NUDIX hydrolase [Parcubacteria group bacterium Athens0416_74]|nr:MAG: NUDIX hydrolase [Parcubacteria group bacterium Athens0416_74]
MQDEDEWLDLVDENDVVVSKKLRSEVHAEKLHNYRAINLFIRNSKGELWIPRRTADKQLYPLGLDFSCAGHVESGHTYEQTLKKEAMEELNIDIDAVDVHVLGKTTPADDLSCFAMNYEIRSDDVPSYNPNDFVEYFWLTPEAVIERIEKGDSAKSGLPKLIRRYYLSVSKNSA